MKKKILMILLCGTIMINLTACQKYNGHYISESNIRISNNDISVSIKEGTLTNTGATFIIENNSDQALKYGEGYDLEIKQNDLWYKINAGKIEVHPILLELEPNSSVELNFAWLHRYGNLEAGEYRMIKAVWFENDDGTDENFYIGTEFTIE